MNKPSLEELKNVFGSKTYSRGFNYYKNGHVCLGVKKDDKLWVKFMVPDLLLTKSR